MRLRHLLPALLLAGAAAGPAALAQQNQDWFVPGQQRPQGQQQPAQGQRPPQGQAQQRPPQAGQRTPAPVVAIVDIPEVQRLSAAFNQVREEIERRRGRLNEDLQREQARWREEQQALAAARATLNPEQLRTRERELQDRITDAQRIFRDRSRGIDAAAQQGLQQIEQALAAVIRQVSSSRGVNLVLPRALVIFNEPAFDLTDEVSAQMNRVLRSVTIPPEGAEAPAAAAAPAPAQPAAAAPAQPPRR
ncbi:OmpH family outer membrane protein [Falsiroseomonas sp. CW058]|uniref:OmpH family outer membrane protein n=1 Tax=Falsiroseomonas sp. CW058 TaxID=3388664 RepID=UPI003D310FF9